MVKIIKIWAFHFELWQLRNHCKRYSAGKPIMTWNLQHYGNDPCLWDNSRLHFFLASPDHCWFENWVFHCFFPFCLLVQTSLMLEDDAYSGTPIKSVVSRRECAICWSPRPYCSPAPSKKLHLLSALAFVYFSLRKNSLCRSLLLVYFCLPSSRTLFILHSFSIQMYVKCPLKEWHLKNCCLEFLCFVFLLKASNASLEEALKKYWLAQNIIF